MYARSDGRNGDEYDQARSDLHLQIIDRAVGSKALSTGGSVTLVFTAGLPGAGKSSVILAHPEWGRFRQLDADDFKDPLLDAAEDDGLLEPLRSVELADGRPIARRELAAFVHAESLAVFDAARERCLRRNEDVVLHGTMNDAVGARDAMRSIADGQLDYDRIRIVEVSVDRGLAVESALSRWWTDRKQNRDGRGGRFVSPRSFAGYFGADGAARHPSVVDEIAAMAARNGFDVEVHRYERTTAGLVTRPPL